MLIRYTYIFRIVDLDSVLRDDDTNLRGGDDKHDHPNEDGEVAVSLAGPVHNELTVLRPPLARGEQKTVALC